MIVVHAAKIVVRSWVTVTTTVCGRSRVMQDGMNIADKTSDVTCKLCRKAIQTLTSKPGGECNCANGRAEHMQSCAPHPAPAGGGDAP